MKKDDIRLQEVLKENKKLKSENQQLKNLLKRHNIPIQDPKEAEIKSRIKLFRSLFKGREDVYAYQWKNSEGIIQYSPAEQKKGKHKNYFPLTDQVIHDHLTGQKVIGIYPVLKNNTCWFLAVDFDKKDWEQDARVFNRICKELQVPSNMERSRSGNGCHVWVFFEEAIPSKLARKLGYILLSKASEKRVQLQSYDRLFPTQDMVPVGKFGNLIALPLQGQPRQQGNSVFVNENFHAFPDQWEYLSGIKKMSKEAVEKIVDKYGNTHDKVLTVAENNTNLTALPQKLEVVLKNGIHIPVNKLPATFFEQIEALGKFSNPEFYRNQSNKRSTYNIPRVIDCTDTWENHLILPRGVFADLNKLFKENKVELMVKNETNTGTKVKREFLGELTSAQEDAVQTLLYYKNGILAATTGFGKTVAAAALISRRKVNTLIIVHTKQLLDQWKERLSSFLQLKNGDVGQIGGGKNTANGIIDVATIQSLNYKGRVKDDIKNYGQIIVDECHRAAANNYEKVLKKAEAAYVHGLTATPKRKDGKQRIMIMQLGPIRYEVTAKDQAKVHPFKHILVPRKTLFKSKLSDKEKNINKLYDEIVNDTKRNDMIFNDVLLELEAGSSPIILTERVQHVQKLEKMFHRFTKNMVVLTGKLKKKERKERLQKLKELPDNEERLIIATGKYIGEGFDNALLDTLFLVMPISWKGTLQQYVGRLHRVHQNKEVVKVYDYVDYREKRFKNMYKNRESGYKALGYVLENDKSKQSSGEQLRLF